jgi:transposase
MPRVKKAQPEAAPAKRPVGRPSMYRPEYCELAIEIGKRGGGPNDIACEIGVLRENLYEWAKVHPEFLTALKQAKQHEQKWWENKGIEGLGADKFNAMVWKVSMQARFRDDYTEKKITEVTGKDGGAIQTETKMAIDASGLDPEAREALRAAALAALNKA